MFNNNAIDVVQDKRFIYPIERITNESRPNPAFKILGVWLDENLTFDFHISVTSKKISKALFSLKKVRHILSLNALKSLYYALIHPHFLYCLPVYCSSSSRNINLLFQLQKRCVRTIQGSKYNSHTDPIFYSLKILPLPDLINQQILNLMHSIVYDYAPASLQREFPINQLNREYQLRNNEDFLIPRINLESLKRSQGNI